MSRRSLQDWASIAEIAGALAIVISLIYVAYELRENTKVLQVTSRQALGDQDLTYFETALDSTIVARALDKYRREEELSNIESSQLRERQHLNFRIFEHAYSLYRIGALETLEWERYERVLRINICGNEPAQEMWGVFRNGFDTEFRSIVEIARDAC